VSSLGTNHRGSEMNTTTAAVDLAKNVYQVAIAS
jgi:hypothetical protein